MRITRTEGYVLGSIAIVAIVIYFAYANVTGSIDDSLEGLTSTSSATSSTGTGFASSILGALSTFENVNPSHNNPGGICGSFDSSGNCLGPKTFASLSDGIAAAEAAITRKLSNNPGMTVSDFVKNWSGAAGTTLDNYVSHVSDMLGLEPNDPIADAGDDDSDADVSGEDS